MIHLLSFLALLLGALIALFNWCSIYASYRRGRFVSPVPLVGGMLLVAGLCGFASMRSYAWLGAVVDYGTLVLVFGVPSVLRQVWQTCSINVLHRLTANIKGRHYELRLFKRGVFVLQCVYAPPAPCNEHGALIQSFSKTGNWRKKDDGIRLEGYAENRLLDIRKTDGVYLTVEFNYPSTEYPYDSLGSLQFVEVK